MKNELSTFEEILDEMNRMNAVVCYTLELYGGVSDYSTYDHELTDPAEMHASGYYRLVSLCHDDLGKVMTDADYSNVGPENLELYDHCYMYTLDDIKDIVEHTKNEFEAILD